MLNMICLLISVADDNIFCIIPDHIRYLNLQENKYISSFAGHTKK